MGALGSIVYAVFMIVGLGFWIVGMRAYRLVAEAANIPWVRRYYSFDVYRYALGDGKSHPESKRIWIGFGGMFLSIMLGGILAGLLGGPAH